jgi:hypothetical protein
VIDLNQNTDQNLESILPNFDFFVFPIFVIKLGHFKIQAIFLMLQTLKLNSKKTEEEKKKADPNQNYNTKF